MYHDKRTRLITAVGSRQLQDALGKESPQVLAVAGDTPGLGDHTAVSGHRVCVRRATAAHRPTTTRPRTHGSVACSVLGTLQKPSDHHRCGLTGPLPDTAPRKA